MIKRIREGALPCVLPGDQGLVKTEFHMLPITTEQFHEYEVTISALDDQIKQADGIAEKKLHARKKATRKIAFVASRTPRIEHADPEEYGGEVDPHEGVTLTDPAAIELYLGAIPTSWVSQLHAALMNHAVMESLSKQSGSSSSSEKSEETPGSS